MCLDLCIYAFTFSSIYAYISEQCLSLTLILSNMWTDRPLCGIYLFLCSKYTTLHELQLETCAFLIV